MLFPPHLTHLESGIVAASSRQLAAVLKVVEFFAVRNADLDPALSRAAMLLIERAGGPDAEETLAELQKLHSQLDGEYLDVLDQLEGEPLPADAQEKFVRAFAISAILGAAKAETGKEVSYAVYDLLTSSDPDESETQRIIEALMKALQ